MSLRASQPLKNHTLRICTLRSSALPLILLAATLLSTAPPLLAADSTSPIDGRLVAKEIDRRLAEHWSARGITPATASDELSLFRRLSLDLTGRIPTRAEWQAFAESKGTPDERYERAVQQFLSGPEFALHFGAVLDEMLQGSSAGSPELVDYLRRSLRQRRSWDAMFREILVGPWESDEAKPARRFLEGRAKDLDRLTTDTARVFFGVDVSCARCHDHPLVSDWKQDHYYGMASFFNRTTGGKGSIGEKTEGEVTFRTTDGTQKTARLMFLSGAVVDEPAAGDRKKFSRREQLVVAALAERQFFSRSFVNRMWQQFFGRGLVHPVDQMHSGNPATVPGLLEWLAEDFAASGYDIHRLVAGIVLSRPYRLNSWWDAVADPPDEGDFAVARVRLLTRRQYALSLLVATGRAAFPATNEVDARIERIAGVRGFRRIEQYLAAEEQAAAFQKSFDPGTDGQSSAAEALYVSNSEAVQKLVQADSTPFVAELAKKENGKQAVEAAILQVYSRRPADGEADRLANWLDERASGSERTAACEQLLWALLTSAEFRFNH